ncbi:MULTISPECIES: thiamine phosphate synthase [unclassified Novosphingobium]|uniref:thiamine phosphate synthase n=1 Tax=unclassified Novosphingobium TaxID=2644732 RepID=UPI000EBA790C|nr:MULTISPECIES: thiamine phosphate synthase [unclassified Novosphingobium]HCF24564.1 thiamine phosphate synthase [Novosphingobium sp.]HQV04569.1 thiamine phosphate synthase [Novosphingobium sp.]
MARCYSDAMNPRQPLPNIWVISDARNDAVLEQALRKLPRGSGLVFRHYHLEEEARRERFGALLALCRGLGHVAVLSGDAGLARTWDADGIYGAVDRLDPATDLLRLATVHDAQEIAAANAARVDGQLLSPVFPTRSHPGAPHLGVDRFRELAALSNSPVIALGGMNAARAAELGWPRWAAIDAFLR